MLEFLRFVRRFKPEFVLCENVPQLYSSQRGRSVIKRFLKSLEDAGYAADYRTVNAADFGVAQHRLRLVILASRIAKEIEIQAGPTRDKRPTVRRTISRFPPIPAGTRSSHVRNHWASALSSVNLARVRAVPKDGGDLRSVPATLRPPSRKELDVHGLSGFTDVYGRMKWDAPAPTLTTRCNSYSNGRYGHPEQDRAISLREAAALQSFPGSYVFYVPTIEEGARLIGNAVPVLLAFHLTKTLLGT
jgi:DNA (cytosine-5)-methyltransferase 1